MSTYTYRHIAGYSALDHLAAEIIARANRQHASATSKRAMTAALKAAIAELRATMGPRSWPRIDIVRG